MHWIYNEDCHTVSIEHNVLFTWCEDTPLDCRRAPIEGENPAKSVSMNDQHLDNSKAQNNVPELPSTCPSPPGSVEPAPTPPAEPHQLNCQWTKSSYLCMLHDGIGTHNR